MKRKQETCLGNMFLFVCFFKNKLYQFFLGGKVYIIPAHQSAQAFLAIHKNLCQSLAKNSIKRVDFFLWTLNIIHNLFYTAKRNQK